MKFEILFLKIAVVLMSIPVLALCILGLPWLVNNPVNPTYAQILYPILAGLYVSVIPFFIALYHAFRLLNYIDQNEAFSESAVEAIKNIKLCAIAFSTLYMILLPFVYLVAELDDAPGLIIVGMVPIFVSLVIAGATAVLQKLFKNAIAKKGE